MRINNNVTAMNTQRQLALNNTNTGKAVEKLSSGQRINRAADDAAGLSISEKMRSQIRGLNRASTNAQDGVSLIQSAESALNEYQNILQRMRELSVQANNGVNQQEDLDAIGQEVSQLTSELDRIATTTEFNNKTLFDGSQTELNFQVGANAEQKITVAINDMQISDIGGEGEVDFSSYVDADDATEWIATDDAISDIDTALAAVSKQRSQLGAVQNRLESTIRNLDTISENLSSAESRIRDVDMAKEMMTFTKNNILSQASTAMLAQANQLPQNVLQLLR